MWIQAEEEKRLVGQKKPKYEEYEEDLQLKSEEEARLVHGAILKVEEQELAWLNVEEGSRLALESRQRAEEEQQQHVQLKYEE